jgi:hypothetical protein
MGENGSLFAVVFAAGHPADSVQNLFFVLDLPCLIYMSKSENHNPSHFESSETAQKGIVGSNHPGKSSFGVRGASPAFSAAEAIKTADLDASRWIQHK